MFDAPLPQELEDLLTELNDCGDLIDDKEYTTDQRLVLFKLQSVGLVQLSWRLTPIGKNKVKNAQSENRR